MNGPYYADITVSMENSFNDKSFNEKKNSFIKTTHGWGAHMCERHGLIQFNPLLYILPEIGIAKGD